MKKHQKGFAPIIILVLVLIAVLAFVVYQIQQESSAPISNLGAKQEDKMTDNTVAKSEIEGWQVYSAKGMSFNYPPEWTDVYGDSNTLAVDSTTDPSITVIGDGLMMGKCMKHDATENKDGLYIKYYSSVTDDEACNAPGNYYKRQIWITKSKDSDSGPGIIFSYTTKSENKSLEIFDQILSTFKFVGE